MPVFILLLPLTFFVSSVSAQPLAVTHTFSNTTIADADQVNLNFSDIETWINAYLVVEGTNTALGEGALSNNTEDGQDNTASGHQALNSNTEGYANTASGAFALYSNTTGYENTASGSNALYSNTTGFENTASGSNALYSNTEGYYNTASGSNALYSNTWGRENTASGYEALFSNTTGNLNTAVGYSALTRNTTGQGNTAVGFSALSTNTTGQYNTAVGSGANVAPDLQNATAIGYNAFVNASDKVRIGNTEVTVIEGQVPFTSSSDARLKDTITPVSGGLALINDLNPVSYHRKNNAHGDIEMGLLAQEVAATLEKHGLADSGMVHQPSEDAYMSLRYNDLLAPMIKAIQELDDASMAKDEQIALLEQKLVTQQEELLAIVQSQQEQIAQLQRMVEQQFAMN